MIVTSNIWKAATAKHEMLSGLPENYYIERRKVKYARIKVSEDLKVRIVVPESLHLSKVADLISEKKGWIDNCLDRLSKPVRIFQLEENQILFLGEAYNFVYRPDLKGTVIVDSDRFEIQSDLDLLNPELQNRWYKKEAKRIILERLQSYSGIYGLSFNRIFIRDQKTKWGNCSSERNLSFNWRLVKSPRFVVDYVVIHELLHTRIMNHGKNFWHTLETMYPGYRDAKGWLGKYGRAL